ncbi:MAG: hypothetical protein ACOYOF_09045 [Verrucomicrobiaceae bacterium]
MEFKEQAVENAVINIAERRDVIELDRKIFQALEDRAVYCFCSHLPKKTLSLLDHQAKALRFARNSFSAWNS